jgi:hypothetical protein
LRDAQVHRESTFEHKNQYWKWFLACLVLLVIFGAVIFAYRGNSNVTTQTATTLSPTNSSAVINNQSLNITSTGGWISATLHPVDKANYNASGTITLTACPYLLGETVCPTIEMGVMNATGFAQYQKGGVPAAPYGLLDVTPTLDEQSRFALHNLTYDGTYYFVFVALSQGNALSGGAYATVSIYLSESWT